MPYSVYLHIPFCRHRCAYCDFNTYAGQEALVPAYVSALCREIHQVGQQAPEPVRVDTIFFGGGTPSLLSPAQLGTILKCIHESFEVEPAAEISLEANPGTVEVRQLKELRAAGFNRISFGVQSANGEELQMLERAHSYQDVLNAVSWARQAGFENLNVDLIYGLPEQRLQTWQVTVSRVLDLQPEHISAYALTLEHGTPFRRWTERGLMRVPDPDAAADMYELVESELARAGYEHYEISNWALPGRRCRHNLRYWQSEPYLGFGAGAHGYAAGYRYSNVLAIREYIGRMGGDVDESDGVNRQPGSAATSRGVDSTYPCSPAAVNRHLQNSADEMAEFMIMGLRLVREGVSASGFHKRFGLDLRLSYQREIERLQSAGLLEWARKETAEANPVATTQREATSEVLRLSQRGRLLGNQVFMQFLG